MELIINKSKSIENPDLTDVEVALSQIVIQNNFKALIQKSENDWLCALWVPTIGIKLEYMDSETNQIFEDVELFISQRRTILLFQAYSKNHSGWQNHVKWVKKGNYSLKSVLQKSIRPIQVYLSILTAILFVMMTVHLGSSSKISNYINTTPIVSGLIFMIIGFFGISFSYVKFMYKDEISDAMLNSLFIGSSSCLILGFIAFLAGFIN